VPRGRTAKVLTRQWRGHTNADGHSERRPDELIVEEPLAIHLDQTLVATTMRTPGHDFELAVGFCLTEGLLGDEVISMRCRYCGVQGSAADSEFNAVTVDTGGRAPPPVPRLGPTTSSCGLCGTTSIHELRERLHPLHDPWRAPAALLATIPDRVSESQPLFAATGAVHAAAAFDPSGVVTVVREDIGRHNAVDKVVGRLLLDGELPALLSLDDDRRRRGLFVSGRASFEMVQKAWAGGFSAVVAVSAPSALAVETARAAGITLAGFVRGNQLNLYTSPDL
jgi:FdhD protein